MKVFKVQYFDCLNETCGPFITIKARSISDAVTIAEYRASKRVQYIVKSVTEIL